MLLKRPTRDEGSRQRILIQINQTPPRFSTIVALEGFPAKIATIDAAIGVRRPSESRVCAVTSATNSVPVLSFFKTNGRLPKMSVATTDIQTQAVDTIRTLSMDAVQTANSGHPGTPMALAPITYQLFNHTMHYDPAHPLWPNRDRFVLSCGHASMLLYSTLHLAGVKAVDKQGNVLNELSIKLEDIKNFRQIGSVCAGHPEYAEAAGIETTTGPLGAGVSNSVGMAMAEKWLATNYNTSAHKLFDYNVYALCSDGDLMEGVACEAASVAGHLKLDNLCWIYDDNSITIEGDTDLAFLRRRWQTI